MGMWDVSVVSDFGVVWRVTDVDSSVFVKASGMSGMVASEVGATVEVVGRPGRRLVGSRVEGLSPVWDVVFVDDGRGLDRVVGEWLRAWREGVRVEVETSLGVVSTRGRLGDGVEVGFRHNPGAVDMRGGFVELSFSWVSDSAVWEFVRRVDAGELVVRNVGDVVAVPSVVWSGSSAVVVLDGQRVVLPSVGSRRRLVLDHADNWRVTDSVGVVDPVVWEWARGQGLVLSRVVPVGGQLRCSVSGGAQVLVKMGVVNPWV